MKRCRRITAGLLILTGCALVLRGADYALQSRGGWQPLLTSLVVGGLIIALGAARLRFWRHQDEAGRAGSKES